VKVERIGPVTIYKRGNTYFLYYREGGISQRRKIKGNLRVARATAHKVADAVHDGRPSPIAYSRTSPTKLVEEFLDAIANVQKLALRTQDRYRAALDRFQDFCKTVNLATIDSVQEATVESFVKWLRNAKRTRNGAAKGKRDVYQVGGIKFILSTCRTAFNWAGRHRLLPPFAENPFRLFPIEKLKDPKASANQERILSPEQEKQFFKNCSDWQRGIFTTLATYGLRVGELTHLLIEDVDFARDLFAIRSKPYLFWSVKTGRHRQLPLLPETKALFEKLIDGRKAGFVFLNSDYFAAVSQPKNFVTPRAFQNHVEKIASDLLLAKPDASEREQKRAVVVFCRSMGQLPERRVRGEFMKLTEKIGCPEFTRAHDLRHLFSSRAQAAGVNPILVQEMLGHTTLEMTKRYTHFGLETEREALQKVSAIGSFSNP
jgi:site-specific recombinase XerD